ncbi:MAG: hypothetical protein JO354_05990 [Verrucomicrobia bacterium]|nr:hypothetical protein [Verrucomicrobiota bacterium]
MRPASLAIVTAWLCCVTVYAQTSYTWTGGGGNNNWSTGGNWSGGNAPPNPQAILHFAGTTNTNTNNNLGAYGSGFQIYFDSGAGAFTLNGNPINFYNYGNNAPTIENDSTTLQTISLSQIDTENSMSLYAKSGSMKFTSPFYLDNSTTLTINAASGNIITMSGTINNGSGSTGTVVLAGSGITVFDAANTYTGQTQINAGELQISSNGGISSSSAIYLGNGSTQTTAAQITLANSAGGQTFANSFTVNPGSGGLYRVISANNTTGTTNTYSGNITLNGDANLQNTGGGTTEFSGQITTNSGKYINGSGGTVLLDGSADNTNIGLNVNSGTVILGKASSSSVHAVGSAVNINSGGTLQLGGTGGDQIYNGAGVTMNGGTFKPAGHSEGTGSTSVQGTVVTGTSTNGMATLTLSSNSTLDYTGGAATLTFLGLSDPGNKVLDITNYTNTTENVTLQKSGMDGVDDRLIFDQNEASNLSDFSFNGIAATEINLGNGYYEIVPVPEPSTWVGAVLAVAAIGFTQRRRIVRLARS